MKRFLFGIFVSASLLVSSCSGNEATGNATDDATADSTATSGATANSTDRVTVSSDSTSN